MVMTVEVDGQLFLGDNTPPDAHMRDSSRGADNGWWGTGAAYQFTPSTASTKSVLYERVLLVTKDPTTLPHSRAECVKWAQIGPIKTCIGWKIEWQWFYVRAILRISTATPQDIKDAVEDCLKEGAIAGLVAAILTGGTAAAGAAAAAIQACMARKIGDQLLSVDVALEHYWGDWE